MENKINPVYRGEKIPEEIEESKKLIEKNIKDEFKNFETFKWRMLHLQMIL